MNDPVTSSFHPSFVLFLLGTLVSLRVWRRFSFRRGLQVFSLNLFVVLLWLASLGGRPHWPVDFFLFSDPLVALVHTLAGRALVDLFLVSLLFVGLALAMGRVFCSHVCPMGTLLDFSDRHLVRKRTAGRASGEYRRTRKVKFVFLIVMLVAALGGFNLLGFGDPLVIFTRFAAVVFYPVVMILAETGLEAAKPVSVLAGWLEVSYLELTLPAFEGALIMAALLILLLLLSRMQPLFWCRHLCPLGALLAWLGRWAPYRRRVSEDCNGCGECVGRCPTGAIHEGGVTIDRSECIVCLGCVRACPEHAVSFGFRKRDSTLDVPGVELSRRALIGGILGGVATGLAMRADILHPSHANIPLPLRHQGLIRPPGALPEPEFLQRCARCGECMRACPTNTLQPDWYRAGLEGLWAPRMNLRHAACDQKCSVCGQVCPTQSIRNLSLSERVHARVGTAIIVRDTCIPWSRDRECLVCRTQCPYDAVVFRFKSDESSVGLPTVDGDKCNGCGRCEDRCPIKGDSAIVVTPHGELRLSAGSYVNECRAQGLTFEDKDAGRDSFEWMNGELP